MSARPRVLLVTEGTYPFVIGGVSAWCDLIVRSLSEFDWSVFALVPSTVARRPVLPLPSNARLHRRFEVWSHELPRPTMARSSAIDQDVPALLARHLIGLDADPFALASVLRRCRERPAAVRPTFRSGSAWERFRVELDALLAAERGRHEVVPELDSVDAALIYQSLYWVARVAAEESPVSDVVLVTAAGWSAIPGIAHKVIHGTPLVVVEHGVFLREAYLDGIRRIRSSGERFLITRLARGLTKAAYAHADIVTPVTEANARWERAFGVADDRIRVVHNGARVGTEPASAPRSRVVASVSRIDPLKDIHTLLHVAAEVVRRLPEARFVHYGPVGTGSETYARSCTLLHARLGLGDRFRFMGRTLDPHGAMAAADVVLLTSISEGMPLTALEAMGQSRPVIATAVGGVPEVLRGVGIAVPSGNVGELASAVCALLRSPALAERLGRRGYDRVRAEFSEDRCVGGWRELLLESAGHARAASTMA